MIDTEAKRDPMAQAVAPKISRRVRFNQAMRLVRRAHLYAGLFMVPWVFLYGITALLFNHPDVFPDFAFKRFHSAELAGTSLGSLSAPEKLAAQIVEGLQEPGYRLVRPEEANFTREVAATARSGDQQYNIRVDLETGEGSVREVAGRPKVDPAPFASRGAAASTMKPPLADTKEAIAAVLTKVGLTSSEVTVRTGPELGFLVEGGGRTWRVQYDLSTGAVSGRPENSPGETLTSRRFLTRLHMAHGYPSRLGARWGWAIAVDLMFVSMVGWGITGLLMWWQMKNLRKIGLVVLALSGLVAGTLTVGMHEFLTSANAATLAESPAPEKSGGRRQARPESPGSEARSRPTP